MRHIIAIPLAPRRPRDQSYTGVVSEKNERHSKISNFNSIHYAFPRIAEDKKKRILPIFYAHFFPLLAGSLNLGIAVSDRTEISRTVRIDGWGR